MSKFGDFEDCIVMKDRSTGRSRGFGYVTFASSQDASSIGITVMSALILEVKVATPKEEMRQPAKKATRIFVERYGEITDLYMPKDPKRSGHRGFGFATFAENGVADRVSRRSHEICGQELGYGMPSARQSRSDWRYRPY
ncbi:hypothetical protein BRARA_A00163 [Brassica rapa]|uniref:RRM domain-containing protein n=1 Tax=Brassica campestris TaxID=3711 RepID=A0A398AI92_BRACM|nr:RNA-binding protein Musashi homolog Rbp6 [Brassica napus]RID77235.1 hypothetical protein BRARA_A00163 [Brassica rapa]